MRKKEPKPAAPELCEHRNPRASYCRYCAEEKAKAPAARPRKKGR